MPRDLTYKHLTAEQIAAIDEADTQARASRERELEIAHHRARRDGRDGEAEQLREQIERHRGGGT